MLVYLKRHHIGLLALFVALGGTSYAATQLPSNSVGARQLRAGAVTDAKIHNGAITYSKLASGLDAKLKAAGAGVTGKTGPTGATGPSGPAGPAGASAALAYGYVAAPEPCITTLEAVCPQAIPAPAYTLEHAVNVTLTEMGPGVFCLTPGAGIDPSNAMVLASPAGGPDESNGVTAVDHTEWIPTTPRCPAGQLEIDTYYVTTEGSSQHVTHVVLPFTFAIY